MVPRGKAAEGRVSGWKTKCAEAASRAGKGGAGMATRIQKMGWDRGAHGGERQLRKRSMYG